MIAAMFNKFQTWMEHPKVFIESHEVKLAERFTGVGHEADGLKLFLSQVNEKLDKEGITPELHAMLDKLSRKTGYMQNAAAGLSHDTVGVFDALIKTVVSMEKKDEKQKL